MAAMSNSQNYAISVVGHGWALDLLRRQYQAGRVPQSLLITGPPHVGKSTLARYFAQFLNCRGEQPHPCGQCLSCRKVISGNHPDIRIFDDDEPLKIDQIRDLQRELALSPLEGPYRVTVLANFERATTGAANALLKTLEEPVAPVVLILTAAEVGALLPTIVSRCQVLTLRLLPDAEILPALQTRWQAEPAQAELLTQLAVGRLGWAIRALEDENFAERRRQRLDDLLDLLRMRRAERLAYAQIASRDGSLLKETLILWLTIWRDILLLKSGSQTKIINLDWLEILQRVAQQTTMLQVNEMMVRLQKALLNQERNVNSRLNLEVLLLKLPLYSQI
jgi:DNA polymerase-3 subunit delta'